MPVQINFFQHRLPSRVEVDLKGLVMLDGDLLLGVPLRPLRLWGKPCFYSRQSSQSLQRTRDKTSGATRSGSYRRGRLQHFDGVLQLKRVTFRFYDPNGK
mgnify:CR=1